MVALAKTLGRLHNLTGHGSRASSYSGVREEAGAVLATAEGELTTAATHVLDLAPETLGHMLENGGCVTHGDPKAANAIELKGRVVLVDWDRCCTVSPSLDVAIGSFGLPSMGDDAGNVSCLLKGYWRERGGQPSERDRIALQYVGHIVLVHDAYAALVRRSMTRRTYLEQWVLPQWRRWNVLQPTLMRFCNAWR